LPLSAAYPQTWDVERTADWFEHALGLPEATEACLSKQLSGRDVMDLFLAPQEDSSGGKQQPLGASVGGRSNSTGQARELALQSFDEVLGIDDEAKRDAVWAILDCISRRVEF
jgi:hypothetical protein